MRIRGYFLFLLLLFIGCDDSGPFLVDKTIWMEADVEIGGQKMFSYQQALNACPPDWSLATYDDWISLLTRSGGYLKNGIPIGDPAKSYAALTSLRGFIPGGNYWTSTPAWNDVPSFRSSAIRFEETPAQASVFSNSIEAKMACRCVKRHIQDTHDQISFTDDDGFIQFDFFKIFTNDVSQLAIYLHRKLEGQTTLDRLTFSISLPDHFIVAGDPPEEPEDAFVERSENEGGSIMDTYGYRFYLDGYDGDVVKIQITYYDGHTLKGSFSGTAYEGMTIQNGIFSLPVR